VRLPAGAERRRPELPSPPTATAPVLDSTFEGSGEGPTSERPGDGASDSRSEALCPIRSTRAPAVTSPPNPCIYEDWPKTNNHPAGSGIATRRSNPTRQCASAKCPRDASLGQRPCRPSSSSGLSTPKGGIPGDLKERKVRHFQTTGCKNRKRPQVNFLRCKSPHLQMQPKAPA